MPHPGALAIRQRRNKIGAAVRVETQRCRETEVALREAEVRAETKRAHEAETQRAREAVPSKWGVIVVGVGGCSGVGKSTLIHKLVQEYDSPP